MLNRTRETDRRCAGKAGRTARHRPRRTGTAHGRVTTASAPARRRSTPIPRSVENRVAPQQLDGVGELVDATAVRRFPASPLLAVNRSQIAVGIGPFIPDGHALFVQVAQVSVAAQNHNNSCTIERRCSFLVVTSGNPVRKSKRSCAPKRLKVPTPVRSCLRVPSSNTRCNKSR